MARVRSRSMSLSHQDQSARRKAAKDGEDVTYVVVLDEIGLAEVSQHK